MPSLLVGSRAGGAFLVLWALLVAGCATTGTTSNSRESAKSAGFSPSGLEQAALVLTTGIGRDVGYLSLGSADNADRALAVRDRIHTQLPLLAGHFGTAIEMPAMDVEREVWDEALAAYAEVLEQTKHLVWRKRPLEVAVPPALTRLAAEAGTRHLVFVRAVGWRMTTEARVMETVANVALVVLAGVMTYQQRSGVGVEMMVVDAEQGRVVWFSQHNTRLDPERQDHLDAALAALVYELHTERRVSAYSFLPWSSSPMVTVWLLEGGRVTGRFEGFEGMQVALRMRDDTVERIPLDRISRVNSVQGGTRLFPAREVSSTGPRLF